MTHTLLVLIILSFFANIHLSVAGSSTSGTAQVRASELIEGSYQHRKTVNNLCQRI